MLDPRSRALYLRMALVGDCGPDKWETSWCTVKRSGSEHDVEVVNRESHGLVVINTMEWLGSSHFVSAFARVVVHMSARYLIGGGDANLNNIIGCPTRGAASVTAVDIEDNRDCGGKKKKKKAPVAKVQVAAATDGGDDAAAAAAGGTDAGLTTSSVPRPTLMRCLFAPGRGPKADEQPTFDALLLEHMGVVRDFTDRVRESIGNGTNDTGVEGAAEYARKIGYMDAAAAEVPTCAQIAARLDVLEACLDEFEGLSGGLDDGALDGDDDQDRRGA